MSRTVAFLSLIALSGCSYLGAEVNLTENGEVQKRHVSKISLCTPGVYVKEIDGSQIDRVSINKPKFAVLSPGDHTFLIEGKFGDQLFESRLRLKTEPASIYTFYIYQNSGFITHKYQRHDLSAHIQGCG